MLKIFHELLWNIGISYSLKVSPFFFFWVQCFINILVSTYHTKPAFQPSQKGSRVPRQSRKLGLSSQKRRENELYSEGNRTQHDEGEALKLHWAEVLGAAGASHLPQQYLQPWFLGGQGLGGASLPNHFTYKLQEKRISWQWKNLSNATLIK